MAYRTSAAGARARVLVVRPQRAAASLGFMILACVMMALELYGTPDSLIGGTGGGGAALAIAFTSLFFLLGARGWFRRVELARFDDGAVTMTWVDWPRKRRDRVFLPGEIAGVLVESSDDGNCRLAVATNGERVPLTGSYTSDSLESKAREMRAFLDLPASE